jgi:hypothetical protein
MMNGAAPSRLLCLSNMRVKRLLFLFSSILLIASHSAYSQSPAEADTALVQVKSSYDNGSFISAELQSRRMLEEKIPDSLRVQFEKYVAFSLVAQGKNDAAVEHFKNALGLDSSLTLDPVLTSPKILGVFEMAKSQFAAEREKRQFMETSDNSTKRKSFPHEGEGPTFRALLFPGWEQSFQGRTKKGYLLLGAGGVAALSTITFDLLRRDARTSYLNASTPELASSSYKTYDRYYKSEFYSAAAFIVIYAYSAIDAFVDLPPYFSLDYLPDHSTAKLNLQINF